MPKASRQVAVSAFVIRNSGRKKVRLHLVVFGATTGWWSTRGWFLQFIGRDLDREGDSDAYEADFIDDRTPPPAEQSATAADLRPSSPSGKVIDIGSSDDMFRRPAGLKSTYICLLDFSGFPTAGCLTNTRFQHKRASADLSLSFVDLTSKKVKKDGLDSGSGRSRFMAGWMEEFMAKQAPKPVASTPPAKPPRLDFDQLELAKGLAASSADSVSTRSAKAKAEVARESPVWDIEEAAESRSPVDCKGKGKASSSVIHDASADVEDIFNSTPRDKGLKDVVDKARDASRSQLSSFVVRSRKGPSTESAVRSALADKNITMAKFFRDHASVLVEADSASRSGSVSNDGE
ncbi:hypothetical protein B0H16DRAFT_1482126 [Mycena metata]|uniref:Uncharacterized protein n=1 Tax=Mycena metata TaxID=1033252 RepID=A0AAD7GV43_9AGAR|nr:hypothetical protein B0H16DRAFT_1482126 [Mycena metata]